MKYEEKNKKFEHLIQQLVATAERDQKISASEAKLLKSVKLTVHEFNNEVEKAMQDGIITSAEGLRLKKIEDELLQNVFDIIEDEDNLDEDTKDMVEVLFEILMNTL